MRQLVLFSMHFVHKEISMDKLRGKLTGDEFSIALLRIWLGEHPADADLKHALLSGD